MRKIIAAALAALLALTLCASGVAEEAMAELRDLKKSAEDAIPEIKAPKPSETPVPGEPTPSPTPDMTVYETLQNGSRGDAVKLLQTKLIALGYLAGSADGVFGGKTEAAVKAFQQASGLPASGIADSETQRALYAVPMQTARVVFDPLKFAALNPGGAQFENARVELSGRVLQVLTDNRYADTAGVYTVMRVATRGICYDVVYVFGFRPADAAPIAEGDTVRVWGTTRGHILYQSVSGKYVDVPRVEMESMLR